MRAITSLSVIGILSLTAAMLAGSGGAARQARSTAPHSTRVSIPQPVQAEHRVLHDTLEAATRVQGRVGTAAKDLAAVLGPHFEREEEIALPPLGLLAPLAAGVQPSDVTQVLAMTDVLRKELPTMLEEHARIRAATDKLRSTAREAHAPKYVEFADELAAHAQMEEDVMYPAAILVGDIIRARSGPR